MYYIGESDISKRTKGLSDYILSLCYDIRHAYQGMREVLELGHYDYDKVTYYGVNIFWPMIIFQVKTMRWLAGFIPTSKGQQAELYRLEFAVEQALKDAGKDIAEECIELISRNSSFHTTCVVSFIDDLCYEYVGLPKAKRIKSLPEIIRSMNVLSPRYLMFQARLMKEAEKIGCSPHELTLKLEYPNFKW